MSMHPHSVSSTSQWMRPVFPSDVAAHAELRAATLRDIDAVHALIERHREADIDAVHALIERHREAGHLLPRTRAEIGAQIQQFVVAVRDDMLVACGELVPLGGEVAEVRSLVVSEELQGLGIGRAIVSALIDAAEHGPFQRLCAFTHAPAFFVRLGFSIVPHLHLPEKVFTDCVQCPLFRRCGQHAVVLTLGAMRRRSAHLEREW
jgi:amino-acid N-acetyltransferase